MKYLNSLMAIAILLTLAACQNDEKETPMTVEEQIELVQSTNELETILDTDIDFTDETIAETNSGGRLACTIQVTKNENDKTITIDFGSSCIGRYGIERSGKIIVSYSGTFNDSLANRVISFEDYYVNDRNITGTVELRNFNKNNEGNLTATRALNNYQIHYPDGSVFTISGSTTHEWIEGQGDADWTNNKYKVIGGFEGVSRGGRSFTREITVPLIADVPCYLEGGFIRTAGEITMTIQGARRAHVRTIDYGDGTCDSTVTITINDVVYPITVG